MSEVERIVRAVLKQGGKVQAVFAKEGVPWELVGVEEGKPRLEHHGQTLNIAMDANTLEGRSPRKGDTFLVGCEGRVLKGTYVDDEGTYETTQEDVPNGTR